MDPRKISSAPDIQYAASTVCTRRKNNTFCMLLRIIR